jgi:hypothetical protein
MNINVHIERLVLDGLTLSTHDGDAIGAALQSELARLVRTSTPSLSQGFNVPSVRATSLTLGAAPKADTIGKGIAQSLYGELQPQPRGRKP